MKPINDDDLNEFVLGYVECALWATPSLDPDTGDISEDGEFLHGLYTFDDIDPDSLHSKIIPTCRDFMEEAGDLLADGDMTQHGHDFFLTRNRHGTGFWDRGYTKERGDALSSLCRAFGGMDFWAENGKVFCE